jgi:hypothetical protein
MRALLTTLLLGLIALSPLASAAGEGRGNAAAPEPIIQPTMVGADYLLDLPRHFDDERYFRLAVLAQLEQQGMLSMGTVQTLAAAAFSMSDGPGRQLQQFHLACDVNGDGYDDVITNAWDLATLRSSVYAINGRTGEYLWGRDNQFAASLAQLTNGLYPFRGGMPSPGSSDNLGLLDANGDGVCDIVTLSLTWAPRLNGFIRIIDFTFTLRALGGPTGATLWDRVLRGYLLLEEVRTNPYVVGLQIIDFPTGFITFDSPTGPKVAFKRTDILFTFAQEVALTGFWISDYRVYDRLHYADARVEARGADIWVRNLTYSEEEGYLSDQSATTFSWITGVVQLSGDGEPEIVLDQYWVANPRGSIEADDPLTGRPLFRYGRGVTALALRGEDGGDLWRTEVYTELPGRLNLQTEEPFQALLWSNAQILPDLTGDGIPDVVVLYLTAELNEATTVQGRSRTHVVPLGGSDGGRVWRGDHQYRGWGFVAAMNVDDAVVPLLALGTTDRLLANEIPPGGRFPEKFVQIRVLNMEDGTPVWDYEGRFAQSNYLPYHYALFQYRSILAPHDWDGDGVKDIVTPARYVRPTGLAQSVLSLARHEYQILSGADGSVLQTFTAWGPLGLAVACPGDDNTLTIVGGHARRMDATRFDVATGDVLWRQPVFNDARIQSATLGSDLYGMTATCGRASEGDDRTFLGINLYRRHAASK